MKIALVCEHGGHLTEMQCLMDVFEDYDFFFITNISPRTEKLPYKKYLINSIGNNMFYYFIGLFKMIYIYHREKPDVTISTGAEIAIPAFIIAKLVYHKKTIYIESLCRVKTLSKSAKLLYPLSDLFIVQWPELIKFLGKKGKYLGSVIG